MILPILISVSVAPTSYLFWSAALTLVTASIARAAENSPNREWRAAMVISLDPVDCVDFFEWEHFAAPLDIQSPLCMVGKKKPSARYSRRASFSRKRSRQVGADEAVCEPRCSPAGRGPHDSQLPSS